jgi:hypothetical protein
MCAGNIPTLNRVAAFPATRGPINAGHPHLSQSRLPDDAVGSVSITFLGIVAGSEVRVFGLDGIERAGVESCSANQVLTLPVFTTGSDSNNVTVHIANFGYALLQFPYTTPGKDQSLPIQMQADPWAVNP